MKRSANQYTTTITKKSYKSIIQSILSSVVGEVGEWVEDTYCVGYKQIRVVWKGTKLTLVGSVGTGVYTGTLRTGTPILTTTVQDTVLRVYSNTLDSYTLSIHTPPTPITMEYLEVLRVLLTSSTLPISTPVQLIGIYTKICTTSIRTWVLPTHRIGAVISSMISKGLISKRGKYQYSMTTAGYKFYKLHSPALSTVLPVTSPVLTPSVVAGVCTITGAVVDSTMRRLGFRSTVQECVDTGTGVQITVSITPTTLIGGYVSWRGIWYRIMGEEEDRIILQAVQSTASKTLAKSTIKRLPILDSIPG